MYRTNLFSIGIMYQYLIICMINLFVFLCLFFENIVLVFIMYCKCHVLAAQGSVRILIVFLYVHIPERCTSTSMWMSTRRESQPYVVSQ